MTPDGGFDVVADASGNERGIDAGLRAVRRGGHYVQVGLTGKPIAVDIDLICLHELVVTSGFASTPRSWRRVEKLVAAGHVVLDPLVTDVLPLSEWETAFARTRQADGLKLMLDPRMEAAADHRDDRRRVCPASRRATQEEDPMSDVFSLEGRNAVVTGLSSGIGQAIAEALARQGANVAGDYQRDADGRRARRRGASRPMGARPSSCRAPPPTRPTSRTWPTRWCSAGAASTSGSTTRPASS